MGQPAAAAADADAVGYLVRISDTVPSGVGTKFKELYSEILSFVSKLQRPYPDDWIHPVANSFDAFTEEAYRFRFDSDYVHLEERAAEAACELEGFMKKVRALPPARAALSPAQSQAAWSLIERCVELLPAETARLRNSIGYTEELQHWLRQGQEILANHRSER